MGNCLRNITCRDYRSIFIEGVYVMIFMIIIGMALVMMILWVLLIFIIKKFIIKEWVNNWLQAIPDAALGAIIFPAILEVKEGAPHVGLIGGIVAIVLAYFGLNVVLVVIGAI